MSKINPKIFLAYDIRGIYPKDFNEDAAYQIGQAFVNFLCSKFQIPNSKFKVVIGRDCRLSAPKIFKSFSQGVISQGANIIDIGQVATDSLYFALHYFKTDASVMITASHNPPEYIGIKMMAKGPRYLSGDWGIPQIKELALKGQFSAQGRSTSDGSRAKHQGKIIKKDIIPHYLKYILNLIDLKKIKSLKVVVDAANGVGGEMIKEISKKIPVKLIPLYFTPDGNFPNHLSDPLIAANLKKLQETVLEKKADFGLALDGDGDRTIFVDEKGKIISSDMIIALFANYYLKKEQKSKIVYNLTCSKSVPEVVKENNGIPIRTRTGHAFMKVAAKENNAIFGGEISGHLYFRDLFFAESGGLTLMVMLKILSESNQTLSELIKKFQRYYRIGEVNFKVENRQKVIQKIKDAYKDGQQDNLDGLTVDYWDSSATSWWLNVRPSNTEPLLRVVVEAKNKEKAEFEFKKISQIIKFS
ncbi:MAG: phosphomannomutase/phosphoglucomutase [Patescibacteria group bacterium]|nr:phosphomannomutase/phosphoglucomutase [Patescibacteria group bacterium]